MKKHHAQKEFTVHNDGTTDSNSGTQGGFVSGVALFLLIGREKMISEKKKKH